MSIALTLLGLLVLAIAVVAAIALQRPATFSVARSTVIAAPAEKIFPLINDVRAFNTWNPYNHKDPAMTGRYSGPASGPGAHYDFESQKSGSGFFEITQANAPSQVQMRLLMTAPFKANNVITFTLSPQGAQTSVTWAMAGPAPFISKFMGVIFNMDRMIGNDFADGLAALKTRAERAAPQVSN
ncbi:MAG: SRPBCC family protein [Pseudomonadota bacterium]